MNNQVITLDTLKEAKFLQELIRKVNGKNVPLKNLVKKIDKEKNLQKS